MSSSDSVTSVLETVGTIRLTSMDLGTRESLKTPSIQAIDNGIIEATAYSSAVRELPVQRQQQAQASDLMFAEDGEEDEYPEGGKDAWQVVGGSFLGLVALFGLINSLGAIQAYVSTHQLDSQTDSQVAWIFSTYLFLTYVFSGQVGVIFDSYGPYHVGVIGSALFVIGIMGTSVAQTYYQFFLSFGIACGIGSSLLMCPLIATVGHWFNRKRGMALGLATAGGSVGGVIFPIMLRSLYSTIGYAWAIRVFGFVCLTCLVASLLLIKTRLAREPLKISLNSIVDLKSLKEPRFAWLVVANFLGDLGVVNGLTYLTSYALAQGKSENTSYVLLTILNATSILGRWATGAFSDKVGRFNTLIGSSLFAATTVLVIWLPFGKSIVGLIIFALLHGFTNGGILSLSPVCCGQISKTRDYGKRYGAMYFLGSFGILVGIPISGALIKGTNYQWLIVFTALAYLGNAACMYMSRYYCVGFKVSAISPSIIEIMSYYLAIIGTKDTPIYELDFGTYRQGGDGQSRFPPEMKEINPFVLHSALDIVEDVQWSTPSLYLKVIDNFYAYMISAFVTAGNVKMLLLHETRNEEPIRQFFTDIYDLYVKTLLSPFYFVNQPIASPVFDQKVRALAKKYL